MSDHEYERAARQAKAHDEAHAVCERVLAAARLYITETMGDVSLMGLIWGLEMATSVYRRDAHEGGIPVQAVKDLRPLGSSCGKHVHREHAEKQERLMRRARSSIRDQDERADIAAAKALKDLTVDMLHHEPGSSKPSRPCDG